MNTLVDFTRRIATDSYKFFVNLIPKFCSRMIAVDGPLLGGKSPRRLLYLILGTHHYRELPKDISIYQDGASGKSLHQGIQRVIGLDLPIILAYIRPQQVMKRYHGFQALSAC